MKPRHLAMGAALLVAGGLVVFGDNTPDVAEPVERAARVPAAATRAPTINAGVKAHVEPVILRLLPRDDVMGDSDGNALFASQNWNPPPPPAPVQPVNNTPPPAPMAPPLPFTLIGKSVSAGAYEVYLARGEQVYLVRDKMTIDGTYRVDKIVPPMLTLTYLPLNQVQQLNIGVFD
ncbi:hypothetical protein [Massilia sp. S19_KUP03_FR1]|uniref:hypothetical protein n=1 Tax=Massilia sp. S19_KUP03_FR1 TaxID=3025503 RepID=UPI002FCD0C24